LGEGARLNGAAERKRFHAAALERSVEPSGATTTK